MLLSVSVCLVAHTYLSTQATTLLTPSSSSAYSSSETKARLLPSASWLAVTLTYSLSCHSTASQLVRTPPRPAAEKQIWERERSCQVIIIVMICVFRTFTAVSWSLSRAAWVPSPVVDSSPSLTGSEGYPKNPAQVPSGNSQLARETSNPLQQNHCLSWWCFQWW